MHAMFMHALAFTKYPLGKQEEEMKNLLFLSALLATAHCASVTAGNAVNTTTGEDKSVKMIWFGASW